MPSPNAVQCPGQGLLAHCAGGGAWLPWLVALGIRLSLQVFEGEPVSLPQPCADQPQATVTANNRPCVQVLCPEPHLHQDGVQGVSSKEFFLSSSLLQLLTLPTWAMEDKGKAGAT